MIPTLAADERLRECLDGLERQTRRDFEIVVVDNSGQGLVRRASPGPAVRVIENSRNLGFGGAINQAIGLTNAPFLATLNEVADGRSVILITHRLTGVERLDRIWRLSAGKAIAAAA